MLNAYAGAKIKAPEGARNQNKELGQVIPEVITQVHSHGDACDDRRGPSQQKRQSDVVAVRGLVPLCNGKDRRVEEIDARD